MLQEGDLIGVEVTAGDLHAHPSPPLDVDADLFAADGAHHVIARMGEVKENGDSGADVRFAVGAPQDAIVGRLQSPDAAEQAAHHRLPEPFGKAHAGIPARQSRTPGLPADERGEKTVGTRLVIGYTEKEYVH